MATMSPPTLGPDAPASERRVFEALRALPDDWLVIHSVKWQALRNRRQGDGEADFVLLHPRHGGIVLEVKGGGIDVRAGQWFSTDRNGATHEVKNPYEQAMVSKHALAAWIRQRVPAARDLTVCHAVSFPDITVDEALFAYGPRPITIDRPRLDDVERALVGVVQHWGQRCELAPDVIGRLSDALAPTTHVRRRLRDDVGDANQELLVLTARQVQVFGAMRLNRRGRVLGPAGAGKTLLAMEKARQLAADGCRTLLTCFNAPLASFMSAQLAGNPLVTIKHFHALCVNEARRAGVEVPAQIPDGWWTDDAPEVLLAASQRSGLQFDALVVDEGQDFNSAWMTSLLALLTQPDDSPAYVFMDSHQDLYVRNCGFDPSWPILALDTNCRNTLQVANRVRLVYGDPLDSLGVNGPEPRYYNERSKADAIDRIQQLVARMLEGEGLRPSQVVVLTDAVETVAELRQMAVADAVFTDIGGRGVVVETLWRFKGLEADVIVLLMTQQPPADAAHRALLYVGLSRPRVSLFVVTSGVIWPPLLPAN